MRARKWVTAPINGLDLRSAPGMTRQQRRDFRKDAAGKPEDVGVDSFGADVGVEDFGYDG